MEDNKKNDNKQKPGLRSAGHLEQMKSPNSPRVGTPVIVQQAAVDHSRQHRN